MKVHQGHTLLARLTGAYRRGAIAACASMFLVPGCGGDTITRVCTAAGCSSGLTVQLSAIPTGAFTVEAFIDGRPQLQYVYRCDGGIACRTSAVFLEGLVTSRVTLRVPTVQGTRTVEFPNVVYIDRYPNGRDCDPRCANATVAVDLPV